MQSAPSSLLRPPFAPGFGLVLALLAAITAIRLIGLHYSVVDLFYDESQYWAWSRQLAFGYFSKPPLLAWIVAAADRVCGSSEACLRAPAPILYFGTSLVVYAIARELYGGLVAFFAALSLGIATGVAFSARIISTDVPLLFFWALALFAYVKLFDGGDARWAALLGFSLGLGLLAKYAMMYFLLGMSLAAWLDRDARRVLLSPTFGLALVIAAVLVAPNIVWNVAHGFATIREIGNNAGGKGVRIDVLRALEFIASQFAVFGPVLFAVLLGASARVLSPALDRADRLMLAFAIPPLALLTALGMTTHANANWAATALVSGTIVSVALLVRWKAWRWLAASLACGIVVQIAVLAGDTVATRVHLPLVGDVYRRTLGWRSFAEQTGHVAEQIGAPSVVGDIHFEIASLLYYWRDRPQRILSWRNGPVPEDNFDLIQPFTDAARQPILYVTPCYNKVPLADYFADVEELAPIVAPTGPTSTRYFWAFKLSGPRGPIPPRGACQW